MPEPTFGSYILNGLPLPFKALQVSNENIEELATTTGGRVLFSDSGEFFGIKFWDVLKEKQFVEIGDYVMEDLRGAFRGFRKNLFEELFVEFR